MAGGESRKPRTLLEDLSFDLDHIAAMLAHLAERDARGREGATASPPALRQVRALIAARRARSASFGHDLSNAGWSLLLVLYEAHLEARELKLAELGAAARLLPATVHHWVERLCATGHARRLPAAGGDDAPVALTEAGAEAVADYIEAITAACP